MTNRIHSLSFTWVLCAALCWLTCGCGPAEDKPADPPVPTATAKDPPASASGAGAESKPTGGADVSFDGIRFTIPSGWDEVPLSAMQQSVLDLRLSRASEKGEVTLTLSSAGGGLDANIERWIGQFELPEGESPKQEKIPFDGKEATWVDLRGTFNAPPMAGGSGPKENWRMLGVAIPKSPQDYYLKLTGPQDAVAEAEASLKELVASGRYVK
jgi:hypothetical protein